MKSLRLLIVDDNQTSRDYLAKAVEGWGWHADSAATGEQGVEFLRAANESAQPYDVVLVDWQMPGMDGASTMQAIREFTPASAMPVILMVSAFGRGKLMNALAASGIDAILDKPVTGSSLFDILHEVLIERPYGQQNGLDDNHRLPVAHRLEGRHILLAEDNALNQIVARGMLEQAGATVDIVENGQMAIDLLLAAEQKYDLVLMDVQMPVLDGFAATRSIRKKLGLTLPVLAMTAGVTESERAQCLDAGMNDFIAKPIDVIQMLVVIEHHLPAYKVDVPVSTDAVVAPDSASGTSDELPAFNIDQLLALAKINPPYKKTLVGLVGRLVDAGTIQIDEARRALLEKRMHDAARQFHTMRGEIGLLGAKRFVKTSIEIEEAIEAGKTELVASLLPIIEAELEETLAAARHWVSQQVTPDTEMPELKTLAPDTMTFRRLWQCLAENNIEACELYVAMRPELLGHLGPGGQAEMDQAMEKLDFSLACACLEKAFGKPPDDQMA